MHFRWLVGLVAIGLALAPGAWAQTLQDVREPETPLVLRAQGSFFVGGDRAEVKAAGWKALNAPGLPYQTGDVVSRQMYVQFQKPDTRETHVPVVFVHGCCLTSKTWETTPDGRMGWYEYFTRKGHTTYLADQVGRGRSALDASIFNEVREGLTPAEDLAPVFVATREMMWNVFRLGRALLEKCAMGASDSSA